MRVISASGPVASGPATYSLSWSVALPGVPEFAMQVEIADAGLDDVLAFAQAVMPPGTFAQVRHYDLDAWDATLDGEHVVTLHRDGRVEHHLPEPDGPPMPW